MIYQQKYNIKDSISEYLKDLTGLNKLASDRHDAGYNRNERLEQFIILGRWITDSCGNFGKIISDYSSAIPAEFIKSCPPVMTMEELTKLKCGDKSISWCHSSELPPDYVKCVYCEQSWTIQNAHDCHSQSKTEVIDATPFIGATLSKINKLPQYDLNPHRVTTDHVRHKGMTEGSKDVAKDYVLQEGDSIFAHVWTYSHNECHKLNIISNSIKEMNKLFNRIQEKNSLNFEFILIKNQYHSDYDEPWYRVKIETDTGDHEITIGWRKSVISIDWSKSKKNLVHLFDSENVTKEKHLIHAWGYEKAFEYLTKIIASL